MKNHAKKFIRDHSGSLSVETVLIFPILVWAFCAMLVFWDGFRTNNEAISATYTVGDLISRQTEVIDDAFIVGINSVFDQLVRGDADTDVRVSVIMRKAGADPELDPPYNDLIWSKGSGELPDRTTVTELDHLVPLMAIGSTLVLVESRTRWEPIFSDALPALDLNHVAIISPRFVSQVKYDTPTTSTEPVPEGSEAS